MTSSGLAPSVGPVARISVTGTPAPSATRPDRNSATPAPAQGAAPAATGAATGAASGAATGAATPLVDTIGQLRQTLKAIADNLAPGARLVIRPNGSQGQYIYQFVDPGSGAIIRQFPQEDLYRILVEQRLNPAPGSFVDNRV